MAASLSSQTISLSKTNEEEIRDENVERSYQIYEELISTLPKEKSWLTVTGHLRLYQGFWYQPMYGLEGIMFAQQHFKARPTDVLLITSPKFGTTWLKAVIFAIMKRTSHHLFTEEHPLLTTSPHDCVPFLEMKLFRAPPIADVENMPSPRLFATHIPYISLPDSVLSSGCRTVYICRNPKDVFVSLWHFVSKLRAKELPPLLLEEAFDLFSRGISAYEPFWDHVQGYWKTSLEQPQKIFFVTYEDMKRDPLVQIKRLAELLGQPFSFEEESKGVVQEIIRLCNFESLSNFEVNKVGAYRVSVKNNLFYRKAKVGDWRNHLTTETIESLDHITKEKLDGLF